MQGAATFGPCKTTKAFYLGYLTLFGFYFRIFARGYVVSSEVKSCKNTIYNRWSGFNCARGKVAGTKFKNFRASGNPSPKPGLAGNLIVRMPY